VGRSWPACTNGVLHTRRGAQWRLGDPQPQLPTPSSWRSHQPLTHDHTVKSHTACKAVPQRVGSSTWQPPHSRTRSSQHTNSEPFQRQHQP
jgi:hypothetical protein